MAELKTKENDASIDDFLNGINDDEKQADCFEIMDIMRDITGYEPKMWGNSIVGFGSYHYKYDSGQEGDWFVCGFSPRKEALTLYIMSGFTKYDQLMSKLGKYKTGKSCLYIKKLADVDDTVLKELITQSVNHISKLNK